MPLSFRTFIEDTPEKVVRTPEEEEEIRKELKNVDPDDIFVSFRTELVGHTFVFTPDGYLDIENSFTTHQDMTGDRREDSLRIGVGLLGRTCGRFPIGLMSGTRVRVGVISFWNRDSADYRNLSKCLKELLAKNYITSQYYAVVPIFDKVSKVSELLGMKTEIPTMPSRWTPDDMRKMHIMPGDVKKKMMQDIGVGFSKKPSSTGGVKWWAPQSENVGR